MKKLIQGIIGGLVVAGSVLLGGLFLYDHAAGIKLGLRIAGIATLVVIPVGALGWLAYHILLDAHRCLAKCTNKLEKFLGIED